jgi:hypothetical protein
MPVKRSSVSFAVARGSFYRHRDFKVGELRRQMRKLLIEVAAQRGIQIVSKT